MSDQMVAVKTTGANGAAAGVRQTLRALHGFLVRVNVKFGATAPATTTVRVEEIDGRILLDLPAGNTDADYYPSVLTHDVTGTPTVAVTTPYLSKAVKVTVGGSNALNPAVQVTLQVDDR